MVKEENDLRHELHYRYQDGAVLYKGQELSRENFIESLLCADDIARERKSIFELVDNVQFSLYQEVVKGWNERGDIGFEDEFGEDLFQEVQDVLARDPKCKIAFFGSAGGAAIRDVFDLPSAENLEVHEFALTDVNLKKSPDLSGRVVDGSLVLHLGPI